MLRNGAGCRAVDEADRQSDRARSVAAPLRCSERFGAEFAAQRERGAKRRAALVDASNCWLLRLHSPASGAASDWECACSSFSLTGRNCSSIESAVRAQVKRGDASGMHRDWRVRGGALAWGGLAIASAKGTSVPAIACHALCTGGKTRMTKTHTRRYPHGKRREK